MPNVVIIGAQWGDEGKGKVVDIFTEFADMVVRFQGGSNAGHTLVVNNKKTILHLIPSGIMHKGKVCVIGNGVVIDPETLLTEIGRLQEKEILSDPKQLRISTTAHVIMPYHKKLDHLRETKRGKDAIGTTGRGIGPCYEDKAARRGIRMADLLDKKRLTERLKAVLEYANFQVEKYFGDEPFELNEMVDLALGWGEQLKDYIEETPLLLHEKIKCGRNILFEGAQGTMLDIDHGTYPFVTSSTTVAAGACSGSGIGPKNIDHIVGITKAYTTRVGAGPFPTELDNEIGKRLRDRGAEYGSTTGRPRRCGWLDMVVLKNTVRLNSLTSLAITKLDVLTGFDTLKLCVGYRYNGKLYDELTPTELDLDKVEPVYEEMPGWSEPIDDMREFDELPDAAKKYLRRIEDITGVTACLVSVGPARGETMVLSNPFRE